MNTELTTRAEWGWWQYGGDHISWRKQENECFILTYKMKTQEKHKVGHLQYGVKYRNAKRVAVASKKKEFRIRGRNILIIL